MLKANAKNLLAAFPSLGRIGARQLADDLADGLSRGNRSVEEALAKADKAIGGFGVEAIRGEEFRRGFWTDSAAHYVNMGDTYANTVLYDVGRDTFYVTTYGDWVEARERGGMRFAGLGGSFGCRGKGSISGCGR